MIMHIIETTMITTRLPQRPRALSSLHTRPPKKPPPPLFLAEYLKNSPIEADFITGLSVILCQPDENINISTISAADLILATSIYSLLDIRKNTIPSIITGKIYSIIPIRPNISHFIFSPILPA